MKTQLVILFLFVSILGFAQPNKAEKILNKIKSKMNLVDDYSANVEISVNMKFLRMPNAKAEIFYKKPNKFKFDSNNFAILPKSGIDFNPQKILEYEHNSKIIGETLIDGSRHNIIKIIPIADSLKFISADLLINMEELLVKKLSLASTSGASIITSFSYDNQKEYALPSILKVNFKFSEKDGKDPSKKRRSKIPNDFTGEITINYSNYKINQGIDDSIFEEDEKFPEEKSESEK